MIRTPTLRQRVNQISVAAFLASATLLLAGFVIYSTLKHTMAAREVERDLTKSVGQQIEQLVPSFLLPEQRSGVELLLDKYRREEGLSDIQIISEAKLPMTDFPKCHIDLNSITTCQSASGKESLVVVPIIESGTSFGWLLKQKSNISSVATRDLFQMFGVFILVLALTFVAIYISTARLLSRTMPRALDDIVTWIEADLTEKSCSIERLPFKELEELKDKVSEVLERHHKERDQAIVGQLTSGIMHDIKTPLQSVIAALHLTERYPPEHPKRLSRLENLVEMCKVNLPIIGRIIETTLDGSRQIHISREKADLVETIHNAVNLNRDLLDLRKVTIEIQAPESLHMEHDPLQVGRVITNLVKNGIEAVNCAEKLPKVSISVSQHENSVVLAIDDNGSGIKTTSEKMFRAFRSSKIHGSGLGLHITRKIIEAHDGSVVASNTSPLGGARFEVRMPIGPEQGDLL